MTPSFRSKKRKKRKSAVKQWKRLVFCIRPGKSDTKFFGKNIKSRVFVREVSVQCARHDFLRAKKLPRRSGGM